MKFSSSSRWELREKGKKFFKIPSEKASGLFNGKSYALKKGLTLNAAEQMQTKFKSIGVVTHLIKEEKVVKDISSQQAVNAENTVKTGKDQLANHFRCKDCGSLRIEPIANEEASHVKTQETAQIQQSSNVTNDVLQKIGFNHYLDSFKYITDIKGRAGRKTILIFCGYHILAVVLANIVGVIFAGLLGSQFPMVLPLLLIIVGSVAGITLMIRRLNDAGKSKWWLTANLIPIVGNIAFLYMLFSPSIVEGSMVEQLTTATKPQPKTTDQTANEKSLSSYLTRYKDWTMSPKGKMVTGVGVFILMTLKFGTTYMADCDSNATKQAFRKALDKRMDKVYGANFKYIEREILQTKEVQFNEVTKMYGCACQVEFVDSRDGNKDVGEFAYGLKANQIGTSVKLKILN